jgi:hypothetical protein
MLRARSQEGLGENRHGAAPVVKSNEIPVGKGLRAQVLRPSAVQS